MVDISVVIRTHNSGKTLAKCLKEVRNQILPPGMEMETIVIDHESTDTTVDIARKYAGRAFSFTELRPNGGYTPGAALNAGFEEASGNVVVVLSSHCFPSHKHSIAAFIGGAAEYTQMCRAQEYVPDMGAMYGRQIPGKKLTPLQKLEIYNVFGSEWQGQAVEPRFFNGYSCILKSAWTQYPFNEELATYEDREWAQRIQAIGAKIIYIPMASVIRMTPFFHPEHADGALTVVEQPWKEEA